MVNLTLSIPIGHNDLDDLQFSATKFRKVIVLGPKHLSNTLYNDIDILDGITLAYRLQQSL